MFICIYGAQCTSWGPPTCRAFHCVIGLSCFCLKQVCRLHLHRKKTYFLEGFHLSSLTLLFAALDTGACKGFMRGSLKPHVSNLMRSCTVLQNCAQIVNMCQKAAMWLSNASFQWIPHTNHQQMLSLPHRGPSLAQCERFILCLTWPGVWIQELVACDAQCCWKITL